MENDYTRLAQDVQDAINMTETAYYNAQDAEDQVMLDDVLDTLREVKERAEAKGSE